MIPHSIPLHVILVHFGSSKKTKEAVAALAKGDNPPKNIIVIDNGPQRETLQCSDTISVVVRPGRNEGYTGGLMVGLGVLSSKKAQLDDIVVCLNNDVKVGHTTMQRLRDWWRKHPQVAIAGPTIGTVNLFTGRTAITKYQLPSTKYRLPYIHGAFFSAPYKTLLRLRLPVDYFLYWEDVLLSRHALTRGIPLRRINNLGMRHPDHITRPDERRLYYRVRNGARFLEGETPGLWRVYWRAANRLRYLYHALLSRKTIVRRALHDARNNVTGPVKL